MTFLADCLIYLGRFDFSKPVLPIGNQNVYLKTLSNDPHKKESANGNARWNVNFFHCYN